jgi:hypothetical protein
MADVRLMLLAVAGMASGACGSAGAQPEATEQLSGIKAPAGWQALPPVAAAARTAMGASGVVVDGAEAWGEPAIGCYALWIALHGSGGGGAEELTQQILDGLAAESIKATDVKPASAGVLALTLERAPYRGQLRARLDEGRIAALACFANQREPAACEPGCRALLGAVK